MEDKTKILFVCHGNICRSPLAEAVFRRIVQDAGVAQRYEIDSAGVSGYHEGDGPDPRTIAEAASRGIRIEHSARRLRREDLGQFDHVLVMDEENLAATQRLAGAVRGGAAIALLRSFDETASPGAVVPDPYYGGERGFADVHDMVERACRGLFASVTIASAPADG